MCVCVCTCNLFTLLYRRIQDCKATIFQLKGKKKEKKMSYQATKDMKET